MENTVKIELPVGKVLEAMRLLDVQIMDKQKFAGDLLILVEDLEEGRAGTVRETGREALAEAESLLRVKGILLEGMKDE